MAQVVSNLSSVPSKDVHAVATYMADVFGAPTPGRKRQDAGRAPTVQPNEQGTAIYTAACATCHESGRPPPYGGIDLGLSTAVSSSDPRNLANIVLSGVRPVEGERSPIMPGFAASMSDGEIAALLIYLRSRFGNQPAWTGIEKTVEEARRTQTVSLQTSAGARNAPSDLAQRDKP